MSKHDPGPWTVVDEEPEFGGAEFEEGQLVGCWWQWRSGEREEMGCRGCYGEGVCDFWQTFHQATG